MQNGSKLTDKASSISKKEGTSYEDELRTLIRDTLPSNANIMPVYVSAQNVFDYDNPAHLHMLARIPELQQKSQIDRIKIGSWDVIESESVQAVIRKAGFDGFYVMEGGKKNLAVYTSNQIKSAIGNNGEFDINNPDIRYKLRSTEEQAPLAKKVTSTEKFKRWFRDSFVVNEDGSPRIMYHGTTKDFNEFIISKKVARTSMPDGFYFSSRPSEASSYSTYYDESGANVMPVYLSIQNPFNLQAKK